MAAEVVDFAGIVLKVASALDQAGVEYSLGGSVATSLQGEPRSTNDIDIAVLLDLSAIPRLAAALGPEFSVDEEMLAEAVRRGRSANIYYLPLVTKIDLFVRGTDPFDHSEFARRLSVRLQSTAPPVRVASPEDNLLRKLCWYRSGNEVSDRQWRDIAGLIRISGHTFDRPYLARWATHLGVTDLLERALEISRE